MDDEARRVMQLVLEAPAADHDQSVLACALRDADALITKLEGERAALTPKQATCRGSWFLGSACGDCERCRDEAVKRMPQLLADVKRLDRAQQLIAVTVCASPALREAVHNELVEVLK